MSIRATNVFDFAFEGSVDTGNNVVHTNLNFKLLDFFFGEDYVETAFFLIPNFFNGVQDSSNRQVLYRVFHADCTWFRSVIQLYCDNRCCDVFGTVDDLVHPWHTLGDTHWRNTCEVESFQSHLSSRLTDRLSSQCSNRLSWFHQRSIQFFNKHVEEIWELFISDPIDTIFQILFVFLFDISFWLLFIFGIASFIAGVRRQ